MDIQIETQNVEIPPHSSKRLNSMIRQAMNKAGLQISRLHLSLRDVNGKKGGRDKVCTVRATLATGGEIVVVDRGHKMRESLFRALRRSRSVIRRELVRRRQRERKLSFNARAADLVNEGSPA
jgi:ribosome-associated translation inhibitor RaiA